MWKMILKKWKVKIELNNKKQGYEFVVVVYLYLQTILQISMTQLIGNRALQMPLIIGIVMQLSQQLSGINAIFYYSTSIFTSAGLKDEMAKFSTIGVGVVMVAMSLVSIMLMDRTGRRTLHLYGLGGMFITSMFLTIFLLFGVSQSFFLLNFCSYNTNLFP